ncbi:MAG: biopolymer transporter ExbD [Pseudomonadota bacterium]
MQLDAIRPKRKHLSLTSLIDIIFLLLLFFMLSSTFSKYSEVKVSAARAGAGDASDRPSIFISLASEQWKVNGEVAGFDTVRELLVKYQSEDATRAVLRVTDSVTSQILVDAVQLLNEEKIDVTLVR